MTQPDDNANPGPLFCARCSAELVPGRSDFFVVHIVALADPTPPTITAEDLALDHRQEIERIYEQMRGMSAQEALDQVHRRLALHLCGPCYREWIENPCGDITLGGG